MQRVRVQCERRVRLWGYDSAGERGNQGDTRERQTSLGVGDLVMWILLNPQSCPVGQADARRRSWTGSGEEQVAGQAWAPAAWELIHIHIA